MRQEGLKKSKVIKRKIILASSSPRRKKILKLARINFKVIKSNLKEDLLIKRFSKYKVKKLVKILALSKALDVITHQRNKLRGNEIIVAFDTLVAYKNKIINKPKNKTDALKKILYLSNKEHKVYTGMAIIDLKKKKTCVDFEVSRVKMKRISKKEALAYIKTKEPLDKAGAYAIQGKGKKFIKSVSGDYLNVVGLPLKKFLASLNRQYRNYYRTYALDAKVEKSERKVYPKRRIPKGESKRRVPFLKDFH